MAQKASSENVGKTPFAIKAYAFRGTYLDNSGHFTKFHDSHHKIKVYFQRAQRTTCVMQFSPKVHLKKLFIGCHGRNVLILRARRT